MHDDADGQAEKLVDAAHPFGVARGEIVVDGDDMDALAGQRVEIDRQRGDQRLALAGAHFGDAAIIEHHAADQLHVERPHAKHAARCLAHGGESRNQKIVERGAIGEIGAELLGARRKLGVGQRLHLVFHRIDGLDPRSRSLDAAIVGRAENLAGDDAKTDHPVVLSIRILPAGSRLNPLQGLGQQQNAPGKRFWTQSRRTDKRGLNRCQRAAISPTAPNSATIR